MKQKRKIRVEGEIAYVTLTKGFEAIIDAEDVAIVENCSWHVTKSTNTNYASSGNTYLHIKLLGLKSGFVIDHEDGDGLNNRKSNLRYATVSQNQQNSCRRTTNTSGYKGVSWHTQRQKWCARIAVDQKQIHIGLFHNLEEAVKAYQEASEFYHTKFRKLAT